MSDAFHIHRATRPTREQSQRRQLLFLLLSRFQHFLQPHGLQPTRFWSIAFSRQEYRSGLPFPSPGDLPNQGTEPMSPTLQADTLPREPPGKPFSDIKIAILAFKNLYALSFDD